MHRRDQVLKQNISVSKLSIICFKFSRSHSKEPKRKSGRNRFRNASRSPSAGRLSQVLVTVPPSASLILPVAEGAGLTDAGLNGIR